MENWPSKKYQIIYADPPWSFNFKNRKNLSSAAKNRLYDTMQGKDIENLPINTIADDNCVLFLWVIDAQLPLALRCIENYGFTYKTVAFTWVKTRTTKYHFGGGNWTRSNPEQCLLATKGSIRRISASVRQLVVSKLEEHSKKPVSVRDSIVTLIGDKPRIELFARQRTPGWDAWGNEV